MIEASEPFIQLAKTVHNLVKSVRSVFDTKASKFLITPCILNIILILINLNMEGQPEELEKKCPLRITVKEGCLRSTSSPFILAFSSSLLLNIHSLSLHNSARKRFRRLFLPHQSIQRVLQRRNSGVFFSRLLSHLFFIPSSLSFLPLPGRRSHPYTLPKNLSRLRGSRHRHERRDRAPPPARSHNTYAALRRISRISRQVVITVWFLQFTSAFALHHSSTFTSPAFTSLLDWPPPSRFHLYFCFHFYTLYVVFFVTISIYTKVPGFSFNNNKKCKGKKKNN